MAGTLTTETWKGGGLPPPPPDDGWGGGGGDSNGGHGGSRRASFTGLYVALAAIGMFFAAFTSAFIVRRGISGDWQPTTMPWAVYLATGTLVVSSVVLEAARRSLRRNDRLAFNNLWTLGTALGLLFLGAQSYGWLQLHRSGIYISTNPSAMFFYVFSAAHAVHLLAGVIALLYVDFQALRLQMGPRKRTAAEVTTVYWHFLDGLWLYLFGLLAIWG